MQQTALEISTVEFLVSKNRRIRLNILHVGKALARVGAGIKSYVKLLKKSAHVSFVPFKM